MKRVFIGIAILTVLIIVFLIYNHKQPPTKEDVFKITENWSPATEEVYLVKKIDGEWLTVFRNTHSIMIAWLEQNWLGFWEMKNELGSEGTLASINYPPLHEEFTWSAGSDEGKIWYYFGQINNPKFKRIEVETKKDFVENALIISSDELRFFYLSTDSEIVIPVIRGYSETGELIYSTIE